MSIASELLRIKNAKEAIRQAIIAKGQSCSTSVLFEEYASKISAIITDNPSSSGGTEYYKCAAVYGPKEVECFIITGCPTAEANGTYLPTEYTIEYWDGTKYVVYFNGTYYYHYNSYYDNWALATDYTSSTVLCYGSGTNWYDTDWMTIEGMTAAESRTMIDLDVPKTWDGYKSVFNERCIYV